MRGRLGPSGARISTQLDEREVVLLLPHRVRVDPKGERRIGVAELVGDPAHALPGSVSYRVDTYPGWAAYPLSIDFYRQEVLGDEGETYLGSALFLDSDFAAGFAGGTPVTALLRPSTAPVLGDAIIATATDADGNTSEFSPNAVTVDEASGAATCFVALAALAAVRKQTRANRG